MWWILVLLSHRIEKCSSNYSCKFNYNLPTPFGLTVLFMFWHKHNPAHRLAMSGVEWMQWKGQIIASFPHRIQKPTLFFHKLYPERVNVIIQLREFPMRTSARTATTTIELPESHVLQSDRVIYSNYPFDTYQQIDTPNKPCDTRAKAPGRHIIEQFAHKIRRAMENTSTNAWLIYSLSLFVVRFMNHCNARVW